MVQAFRGLPSPNGNQSIGKSWKVWRRRIIFNFLSVSLPDFGTQHVSDKPHWSLLTKKSNVKQKRRFFPNEGGSGECYFVTLFQKIIISSKVNELIKGLANVMIHLKAYLINTLKRRTKNWTTSLALREVTYGGP